MKPTYFEALTRAARWHLPPAEAQEVLEDYAAMLEETPRSEEELRREVGDPTAAVMALVEPKKYRRWLLVFGMLTVWLMLPALSMLPGYAAGALEEFLAGLSRAFLPYPAMPVLGLLVGILVALLWFRGQGLKTGPRPRGLLPLMLVPLAGMAAAWWVAWVFMFGVMRHWDLTPAQVGMVGPLISGVLDGIGLAAALLGLWALVRARLKDRRWAALFILALAAVTLILTVLFLLHSYAVDIYTPADWWHRYFAGYLTITLLGLAGTGVALC